MIQLFSKKKKPFIDKKNSLMWASLMWAAEDNSWLKAFYYCHSYEGEGFTDWRMPTINDLVTLVGNKKIKIYNLNFPKSYLTIKVSTRKIHFTSNMLWSSNFENFENAKVFDFNQQRKISDNLEIPFTYPQALPVRYLDVKKNTLNTKDHFLLYSNGVIEDKKTGLHWTAISSAWQPSWDNIDLYYRLYIGHNPNDVLY